MAVLAIGHFFLFTGADGDIYFGSAALMSAIAAPLIANTPNITNIARDALRYCGMSWAVNLVGWVSWFWLGAESTGYNIASIALYGYLIIVLTRSDDDRRLATLDWWAALFRSTACQHIIQRKKDKGTP